MEILKNRPLALSALFFFAATLACYYVPKAFLIGLSVLFLLLALGFCLLRRKGGNYGLFLAFLVCIFVLAALLRGLFYWHLQPRVLKAATGSECTVVGEIEEFLGDSYADSEYILHVATANGKRTDCRAVLRLPAGQYFEKGSVLSAVVAVADTDAAQDYEGQEKSYLSDGCVAILSLTDPEKIVLLEKREHPFLDTLDDWREALSTRLHKLVGGEEGDLLSALLLGERAGLDGTTVRDFRRAGVSHLLALSGLHLGMLTLFLFFALALLHVGKTPRVVLVCVLAIWYLLLTGCSFSMLRAVIMLGTLQLAYFCRGRADALTSLSLAAALILFVSPFAVFSLSFQMTMIATFGILTLGSVNTALQRLLPSRRGARGRLLEPLRRLIASLVISLAATFALLPLQWLVFGEISLLTPLSNLLLIPFTYLALIGGILLLLFGRLGTLLRLDSLLLEVLQLMLQAVAQLSRLPAMLSLRYDFVPYILLPFTVLTLLLLCVKLRHRLLIGAPALAAAIAFAVCLAVYHIPAAHTVIYRGSGKSEGLLVMNADVSVIVDISNASLTQLNNHYTILKENYATEVTLLVFTHYHDSIPASLSKFSSNTMLRTVWLPTPQNEAEEMLLAEVRAVAERRGIAFDVFPYGQNLTVSRELGILIFEPLYEKRSVQPALRLELYTSAERLTYVSAAYLEYAAHLGLAEISAGDHCIIGDHGPVPHEPSALPKGQENTAYFIASPKGQALLVGVDALRALPIDEKWRTTLKNAEK